MYSNELKMTESREARIIFRITTTTCNNLRNIKLKQKSREFDQKLIFFLFRERDGVLSSDACNVYCCEARILLGD